jgi:uncharacterized phage infection (PIP) family protein YhgE
MFEYLTGNKPGKHFSDKTLWRHQMCGNAKRRNNMKFVASAAISLFLALAAYGQTPGDQATSTLTEMGKVTAEIKQLDASEGKLVKDREVNLTSTDELLKGSEANARKATELVSSKIEAYKNEVDQQKAGVAAFAPQADAYNSQCNGTGDQNYVNNCNAWKARLQPEQTRLNNWRDALKGTQAQLSREWENQKSYNAGLKARRDQLSQDTLDWAASKKKYYADRDDLGARFNTLRDKLNQVANRYSNCTKEFINNPKNTDELIKHKCGNIQFDGADFTLKQLRDIAPAWRMQ